MIIGRKVDQPRGASILERTTRLAPGALVPKFFYNFVFSELSVDTIRAHIFYTNINVIKMHLLQGYQFEPSNDYVIEKSGRTILLVAMCYSAEDFFRSKQIPKAVDFPMKNWKRSR